MSCNNNLLGTKHQVEQLQMVINNAKKSKWKIVKLLQETQKIYGYLPKVVIKKIAAELNIPDGEIYSVITFYAEFSLVPKGKYPISVCMGTACYVKGAGQILEKLYAMLKIKEGQCTDDGLFSIDQTRCIGCCGMAPVMTVGEDVYGNITEKDVEIILHKYMEKN